ncbi:hypothetical protein BH10PSE16_BH10PSE16_01970 [soil metagenome]
MKFRPVMALSPFLLLSAFTFAQPVQVMRDLESRQPHILSKDELQQLLPGATMRRVTDKGNTHAWSNDADGTFIVSSDNRATSGRDSTAQGKWHLSDDGRYCVLIDWKRVNTEEWCRFVIKTLDGYYTTKSDKVATEKVYKFEIIPK